ncbi:MAG TPA: 23S rRNA (adenine(2503)-C(2))-methyltransferase RlmN [Kiritimatiellia bacterium]|nr:23S rRNA (adenine(2503)-C(2))-methyltransferase RlmN [Kiritimatiellia bacterium]HMO97553.1 23S rRNA (adenine(2503)-C(2))-methyltransferase RlmN [Kiritimatiellia bacterium]HMP95961.1 23S rRNA (adenine(2503)-C(2))-methyltransferase RlmN [Kiritimatiellia bacterium]
MISSSSPSERIALYNQTVHELVDLMASWGQPAFRARQVYRHLYVNVVDGLDAMTDVPRALRERLAAETDLFTLKQVGLQRGDDGLTRKALFALPDGSPVESVLMVYPDRATVCVSSQSGCPMACTFCATGKLGFLHDLTSGQIIEQVMWAVRELRVLAAEKAGQDIRLPAALGNVVFMGMGEPFNNYANWWATVDRLHDPQGFNMGARSFTVSTVGLVPGILKLAEERLPINLAISLHAPDDDLRVDMMPVNKRYPIRDLIDAVRAYVAKTNRRVSFEYVLLQEKNDLPEQAERLADLLRKPTPVLCHVNLIPWNPVPGTPLSRSNRRRVLDFQKVLQERGVPCTVRVERGTDIAAACGQLAGSTTVNGSAAEATFQA